MVSQHPSRGRLRGALSLTVLVAVAASNVQVSAALAADYGRAFLNIAAILVAVAVAVLARLARKQTWFQLPDHWEMPNGKITRLLFSCPKARKSRRAFVL
jgi:hypothetical protein